MTPEEIQQILNGPVLPDPSLMIERTSPRHGLLVQAPANLPDIGVDNEVSFRSGMPSDQMYGAARFDNDDDFLSGFGFTGGIGTPTDFIKGVAKAGGDLTVGFAGKTLVQLGDSVEVGEGTMDAVRVAAEADIAQFLSSAINPIEYISTVLEDFGRLTGTQDKIARRLQSLGRRLIDRNDRWIAKNGLAVTESGEPTLLHALGEGTTTVAGAIGLAFVTKSPTATALLFGQIQESDMYIQAREHGLDVNSAQFYASIAGAIEAAVEKIGLDVILKSTGLNILGRYALGFGTEAIQESLQTTSEILIADAGEFANLKTREEKIQAIKQSALIGGLLGGPSSVVFGGTVDTKSDLAKRLEDTVYTELSLEGDVESGRPTIELTSKMVEDQNKVTKIIQDFIDGVNIRKAHPTRSQKDADIARSMASIRQGRVKAGQEIVQGKRRALEEAQSDTISKLSNLATEAEQFVISAREKFQEMGYSQETIDAIEAMTEAMAEAESGNFIGEKKSSAISEEKLSIEDINTIDFMLFDLKIGLAPDDSSNIDYIKSIIRSSTSEQLDYIKSKLLEVDKFNELEQEVHFDAMTEAMAEAESSQDLMSLIDEAGARAELDNIKDDAAFQEYLESLSRYTNIEKQAEALRQKQMAIESELLSITPSLKSGEEYKKEPPVPKGMVRVYHSGSRGDGDGFGRWVSTSRDYASNYRSDLPLFYFDIMENDPRIEGAWPDQGVKQGFTFNFELTPDEADNLTEISRSQESTSSSELAFEQEVFKATGKVRKMRDNLYRQLSDISEKVLARGVKAGEKSATEELKFARDTFDQAVAALPVDAETKQRFQKRSKRVTPNNLIKQLDRLRVDAIVAYDKMLGKEAQGKVAKLLKSGKPRKSDKKRGAEAAPVLHADIQDSLQRMSKLKKKDVPNFQATVGNDPLTNLMESMESRYAALLASEDTTSLDWQIFAEDLESIIDTGKTAWQARNADIKRRKEQIINDALKSKPNDGKLVSALNKATGAMGFSYFLWTFDTAVKMAGLENTVLGRILEKDKVNRANIAARMSELTDIMATTMSEKFDKKTKKITITSAIGKQTELGFDEAVQFYMYGKDNQVRKSMQDEEGMAYTDDNFIEVESFIGTDGVKMAEALFDYYRALYPRINEEYRKRWGVSLKKRDFYSTVSRINENGDTLVPVGDIAINAFGSPQSFKKRTNSTAAIQFRGAIENALRYSVQTEWWLSYNNLYEDSYMVLNDPNVRELISSRVGKKNLEALDNHLKAMKQYSSEYNMLSGSAIDWMRKNFTRSTLGANPQIGIKQLSSALASLSTVPMKDYALAQAEFWNPAKMIGIMKMLSEHDTYKRRGKHFDPEIIAALELNSKKWFGARAATRFVDFSLLPVRIGDKLGLGASVYAEYKFLTKNGVPHEKALDRAMDNAERSQQSVLPSQLNLMQKDSNPIWRMVSMFTSSPIALMNMEMRAIQEYRDGNIDKRDMLRRIAVYHILIPSLFGYIATAFDTEPEEVAFNAMLGSWGSTPFYGASLTFMGNAFTEAEAYQKKELAPDLFFEASKEGGELAIMAYKDFVRDSDSFTMEEYFEALGQSATVFGEMTYGIPVENTVDMLGGFSELYGGGNKWDGFLKTLGWSDYIIEQDNGGGSTVRFNR